MTCSLGNLANGADATVHIAVTVDSTDPLTNTAKEVYRLAMREGHAAQDFSAVYDYLVNHDER